MLYCITVRSKFDASITGWYTCIRERPPTYCYTLFPGADARDSARIRYDPQLALSSALRRC